MELGGSPKLLQLNAFIITRESLGPAIQCQGQSIGSLWVI